MAGAGYKLFNTGDVLTAAQVNTYLQEQTVMVFANSTARTTALSGVLAEGMVSYLQDTNAVEVYNGSAWVGVSGAGDITEVQAGVGISIASGTGPIPVITNSSTDLITTAGDLLYGTAADTVARLGIGTAGQVLKVNSGATAPEWGAAGGGDLVKISSVTWSSASAQSLTSVFSATYDNYCIIFDNLQVTSTSNTFAIRLRSGSSNNTTSNYYSASLGYRADGTSSNYNQNPADFWGTSTLNASPHVNGFVLWVFNPYESVRTTFAYQTFGADSVSFLYRNGGGLFNGNTSFDGLGFFLDAGGSVSGDVTVYGYKK